MSDRYAVLIDGGFMKKAFGSAAQPLNGARVENFLAWLCSHRVFEGSSLYRSYFYDASPLDSTKAIPLGGGNYNFKDTPSYRNNATLHQELKRVPNVAIRMGELVFRGWSLKQGRIPRAGASITLDSNSFAPNVQQKGVDMRIGLDIAALTLKGHVKRIAMVTGDSDFVPAMKFARREGVQLYLFTLASPVQESMREHSDILIDEKPSFSGVSC
jgi:uncharacterized LabA/DUF88 family protein